MGFFSLFFLEYSDLLGNAFNIKEKESNLKI